MYVNEYQKLLDLAAKNERDTATAIVGSEITNISELEFLTSMYRNCSQVGISRDDIQNLKALPRTGKLFSRIDENSFPAIASYCGITYLREFLNRAIREWDNN